MVAEFFDSQKETMLLLYHHASKFPVKLVTNYIGNGGTNQKYQWKVCNGFLVIKNRNHNDIQRATEYKFAWKVQCLVKATVWILKFFE